MYDSNVSRYVPIKSKLMLALVLFLSLSYGFDVNGKTIENTSDRYMLIPGGDAVGIHIQTDGLIVVDTYTVQTKCGEIAPARDAGLVKGDVIVAINSQKVAHIDDYKEALINNEGNVMLTIERAGVTSDVEVSACRNMDGDLTTGIYLRNKIAGIGTLTYVDPATNKYGALGHEIIDQDTNELVDIYDGNLINSNVTSIRKATSGTPGEKVADIYFDDNFGTIDKNNEFGIYGVMDTDMFKSKSMLPIGYQDEIKIGPAQILTVLNGQDVEEFNIEIIEIERQSDKAVKGIKYVVTDARLIDETGGIVQGMSGSPIIQDDKIIGAVTHVLVHDSTLGYGVFIEWMLEESEIDYHNSSSPAPALAHVA